mmetsp:Transcript_42001/g.121785  ORF Transcript_42001/g.121785 Transcript_42001/m.121785 type:complete len:348 (+) Transcript_42001:498-1541(+)
MVEYRHEEIHILLTFNPDVAEDGINHEHIALLRSRQLGHLLTNLQVQQKLSLLFDEVEHLFHLRGRILAGNGPAHLGGLDRCALACGRSGLRVSLELHVQLLLLRHVPLVAQLLLMDQAVGGMNFVDESSDLLFAHLPNLAELFLVGRFEMPELLLQVLELPRETFVLFRQLHVLVFVLLVESVVPGHESVERLSKFVQPVFVSGLDGLVLLVTLCQHLQVVVQFLLVEQVCGHHLFQVLLKLLDALLQCNFALVEIVGELLPVFLDLLLEAFFAPLPPLQEFRLLHLAALLEQGVDLSFVFRQQFCALLFERVFDLFQLLLIVLAHGVVLLPHLPDDSCDVRALLL